MTTAYQPPKSDVQLEADRRGVKWWVVADERRRNRPRANKVVRTMRANSK